MDRARRSGRRWAATLVALAAVGGGLTGCAAAPVGIGVTGGEVDTHRTVTAGERVRVVARGTVDFGGGFAGIGALRLSADGEDGSTPADAPAPHLRRNSLVVRIGDAYYQGGVDTTFVPATDGTIVLVANTTRPPGGSSGWDVQVETADQEETGGVPPLAFQALPVGGTRIETQVYVDAGSTVRLTSAGVVDVGRVSSDDASPRVNADGTDGAAGPDFPAPYLRPNSLIVHVDGDSVWYQGGSDATFVPTRSGALILAVNDDDLRDDTQSWFVSGRVTPPAQPGSAAAFGPFLVSNTAIETGLTVAAGQRVHVESRGLMSLGEGAGGDVIRDADGDGPDSPTPPDYPAPGLRLNSLLVRVGDTDLQGGRSVDVTARRSGPLVLLVNDVLPENNRSVQNGGLRGWSVTVTLG